jgi:hypothetical protein
MSHHRPKGTTSPGVIEEMNEVTPISKTAPFSIVW